MPKHPLVTDEQYFSQLHQQFVRSTAVGHNTHTDFHEIVGWLEQHSANAKKIKLLKSILHQMEDGYPHMMLHHRTKWLSLRERAYHCVRECVLALRDNTIHHLEAKLKDKKEQLQAVQTESTSAWIRYTLSLLQPFLNTPTKTPAATPDHDFGVTLFGESVRPYIHALHQWLQGTDHRPTLETLTDTEQQTINGFLTLLCFARIDHHKRHPLPMTTSAVDTLPEPPLPMTASAVDTLPEPPLPIASLVNQFIRNHHLDNTAWCILWANYYAASNEVITEATFDLMRNIKSAELNELFDLGTIDSRMLLHATAEFRVELGTPTGLSMIQALKSGEASKDCLWEHYPKSGLRLHSFFNPKLKDGWQIRGIGLSDATNPTWRPETLSQLHPCQEDMALG